MIDEIPDRVNPDSLHDSRKIEGTGPQKNKNKTTHRHEKKKLQILIMTQVFKTSSTFRMLEQLFECFILSH